MTVSRTRGLTDRSLGKALQPVVGEVNVATTDQLLSRRSQVRVLQGRNSAELLLWKGFTLRMRGRAAEFSWAQTPAK